MQISFCRAVVTSVVALSSFAALAAAPQSPALAQAVVTAMTEQKLPVFVAATSAGRDHFVGALAYPGVQLLVVSARSTDSAEMTRLIGEGKHKEAYALLNQASVNEGKLFVQDMKADGLRDNSGTVDVVYQNETQRTLLNGAPGKQGLSEQEYEDRLTVVDTAYSAALQQLLDNLNGRKATQN